MAPRSLNRREYGEFKQMLEQALLEIRLPAGIVDSNHIVPNSINPENCNLDASWDFRGNVFLASSMPSRSKEVSQQAPSRTNDQRTAATSGYSGTTATNSSSSQVSTTSNIVNEVVEVDTRGVVGTADIYFMNALRRTVTLTLPVASQNIGRKIYVKRVDKEQTNLCRVLTVQSGKLDGTDGIELNVQESVILIASSTQWHVFSLDFKL